MFDLFTKQFGLWLNNEFFDSSVIFYALLYVFSFGTLFEECTISLYTITKAKNTKWYWLLIMFVTVFIVVYSTIVLFVYTDYDF